MRPARRLTPQHHWISAGELPALDLDSEGEDEDGGVYAEKYGCKASAVGRVGVGWWALLLSRWQL